MALAVNARGICLLEAFSFGQFDSQVRIDLYKTRIHGVLVLLEIL